VRAAGTFEMRMADATVPARVRDSADRPIADPPTPPSLMPDSEPDAG
jgi:hypothetical protein